LDSSQAENQRLINEIQRVTQEKLTQDAQTEEYQSELQFCKDDVLALETNVRTLSADLHQRQESEVLLKKETCELHKELVVFKTKDVEKSNKILEMEDMLVKMHQEQKETTAVHTATVFDLQKQVKVMEMNKAILESNLQLEQDTNTKKRKLDNERWEKTHSVTAENLWFKERHIEHQLHMKEQKAKNADLMRSSRELEIQLLISGQKKING
jgi:hypothetical protein